MCFKADAFTHTMTSYMRKRESMRNGGGGGRKRNKKGIDEHRWQRKRIVVGRKRELHCAAEAFASYCWAEALRVEAEAEEY